MHKLRHPGMAWSLKLSAFFFIVRTLGAASFLGILTILVYWGEMALLPVLGISFVVALVGAFASYFFAYRARCQLCQFPLMLHSKCTKHLNSRKVLGSHRLRLSFSAILLRSFICPFCGERFSTTFFDHTIDPSELADPSRTTSHRPLTSLRRSGATLKKRS